MAMHALPCRRRQASWAHSSQERIDQVPESRQTKELANAYVLMGENVTSMDIIK
jgi:hypothetical protein